MPNSNSRVSLGLGSLVGKKGKKWHLKQTQGETREGKRVIPSLPPFHYFITACLQCFIAPFPPKWKDFHRLTGIENTVMNKQSCLSCTTQIITFISEIRLELRIEDFLVHLFLDAFPDLLMKKY